MTDEELYELFQPHVAKKRADLGNHRLVHYTSAEAGQKIVASSTVWLRNAQLMNDFSEMQHGYNCLERAWTTDGGQKFRHWLDSINSGMADAIAKTFDAHRSGIQVRTFLISLSEHYDSEDELGRLSMWRAYGGKAGIGLVLNTAAFQVETDAVKAYTTPVFYVSPDEFAAWFNDWVDRLIANTDRIKTVERSRVEQSIFFTFRMFMLCLKHKGFAEEREWRVFHSPELDGPSPWLSMHIENIRGIPQEVVKLSLYDVPGDGVTGLAPSALINRVIIGPTAYPLSIQTAMAATLQAKGCPPTVPIWASLIPLRDHN